MEPFELYILDRNFDNVCIVNTFESMIWTDRYRECGDFELYLSASSDVLVYAIHGYYIWMKNTDRLMIIESTEIETDVESGNHLKITGRSLESILDRRIIWHQTTVSGSMQTVIKKLITDAIINPALDKRKISNFIFIDNNDSRLLDFEIEETQYLGDNLYEVITDICGLFDVGFKVIYNFTTGNFEFSLYYGIDRSYSQDIYPWVVFSPEFDNIISSDFIENSAEYKNVNLICGEKKDNVVQKFVFVDDGSTVTGLDRKEMYTDGGSNSQDYTDDSGIEVHLTDAQYLQVLKEKALEELYKDENRLVKSFDGEMNTTRGFKYGVDFDIGDIVQMQNEYGLGSPARVIEMIHSQDTGGIKMYPTFESINNVD